MKINHFETGAVSEKKTHLKTALEIINLSKETDIKRKTMSYVHVTKNIQRHIQSDH